MSSTHTRPAPGEHADMPVQIPPRGWLQVTKRAIAEARADNVPVLAGGVAFFAFLSLFPALIAALTIYGLVADPTQVARQIQSLAGLLPASAQPLIAGQLNAVAASSNGALGVSLLVSVLVALWSASSGMMYLVRATNVAYDEEETRGIVKLRAIALILTFGAVVFVLISLALVALVPVAFDAIGLGGVGLVLAQIVRWVVLIGMVMGALAVVYRIAPSRQPPRFAWVSVGAVVATLLWIVGSVLFSVYVNNFGSYNKTYGALAGVIVLMLWLFLTSYIVLLGAEINAEAERQTVRDSTVGTLRPVGRRGAEAADQVASQRR